MHLIGLLAETDLPGPATEFIVINAPIVTIVMGLLIPVLNGLLTKWTMPSWVKFAITALMNTVVAVFTANAADNGDVVFSRPTLYSAILGTVISFVAYNGLYKPLNVTSSTPTGRLAPRRGLGPDPARIQRAE